eukprot:5006947-Pyramimonas_sp.AAC.1
MAPRGPPGLPRGPQEGSKSAPKGPKRAPRGTRKASKRRPSNLRQPKMTSKMAQIAQAGSRCLPRCSRRPHDRSKTARNCHGSSQASLAV